MISPSTPIVSAGRCADGRAGAVDGGAAAFGLAVRAVVPVDGRGPLTWGATPTPDLCAGPASPDTGVWALSTAGTVGGGIPGADAMILVADEVPLERGRTAVATTSVTRQPSASSRTRHRRCTTRDSTPS